MSCTKFTIKEVRKFGGVENLYKYAGPGDTILLLCPICEGTGEQLRNIWGTPSCHTCMYCKGTSFINITERLKLAKQATIPGTNKEASAYVVLGDQRREGNETV
jgi:hypothetical protein